MAANQWQYGITGGVVAAAIGLSVWQHSQLKALAAENSRLAQIAVMPTPGATHNDTAQLQRLRDEHQRLTAEIARLRTAIATNQTLAAPPVAPRKRLSESERSAQYKLIPLKCRISLTPEQEQKVLAIYKKLSDTMAAHSWGQVNPAEDRAWQNQTEADTDTQIMAVLSPDQLPAWQQFQAANLDLNAQAMVNSELNLIQNELPLTAAQQDQAFPILLDLAHKRLNGTNVNSETVLTALSGILKPDQAERYRDYKNRTNGITVLSTLTE